MYGIYNYTPQTNYVSRVHSFAATLYLQFMLHVVLFPTLNVMYFYITTSRRACAVPNMVASCSSLISCFPDMSLRYCLNYSAEIKPAQCCIKLVFHLTYTMMHGNTKLKK